MTDAEELILIQRDIDAVRQRIGIDRRLLAEQLAPYGGGPDLVDELLTACDEHGAAHVRDQLIATPARFGLSALPSGRQALVGQLLDQLTDASDEFDTLVGARESLLVKADPSRSRVLPWFGREFQLDATGRTLRFADKPTLAEPAEIVAVPNRIAPTRAPDIDVAPVHRRRRDRER